MGQGVWVFAEHKNGEFLESSLEVISEGRRLADQMSEELCILLLGCRVETLVQTLGAYGAERVFIAEDAGWAHCQPEPYSAVLSGLVKERCPSILLFAATGIGEDLAPRVAARVRAGLSAGCDKLQLTDGGSLLQTYLAHDNKVHMTVSYDGRPQMATVRPGAMKIRKIAGARTPAIVHVDPGRYVGPGETRTRVLGVVKADPKTIDVADAEIILAGGRGVGGEGFQILAEMADLLGAAVAGSRMAVDAGWIGRERQIGQSGRTVAPDLLISCGISGASAHTIGMREARTVIAINKDQNAPMLKLADLGVVGDFNEVAPVLLQRLRKVVLPKSPGEGAARSTPHSRTRGDR